MSKTKDLVFRLGLLLKGADSLLEVLGGLLLTQPIKIARYLSILSQHEAYKQHQILAGHLEKINETITTHTSLWQAAYLMAHGVAKVVLIVAIVRNRKWGYIGLIGVLSLFTLIEMVRALTAREIFTGAFGVLDLLVAALIYSEYRDRFSSKNQS
jgi:uncharacterized membrane protein